MRLFRRTFFLPCTGAAMSDNFSNNPFARALAGLKAGKLAQKGSKGRDDEERARETRMVRKKNDRDFETDADSELFLRHMGGVSQDMKGGGKQKSRHNNGGTFCLSEMNDFAAMLQEKEEPGRNRQKADRQKDRQKDGHSKKTARPAASLKPEEKTAQQKAAQDAQSAQYMSQDMSQDMSGDISMAQLLNGEDDRTERAFAKAMQGVKPLTVQGGREVVPAKESGPLAALAGARLDEQLYGRIEFAVDKKDEYVEGYVVGLDPRILDRLKAGAICPESSTDLHGLRVENSFEELRAFIRRCWEKGMRCLVIVHGRGKNSPGGVGVLCDRLRLWLTQEPFKRVVLAFCTAKPRHGGPGSLYVLLRKYKKKAPVSWDATPYDLYQQD